MSGIKERLVVEAWPVVQWQTCHGCRSDLLEVSRHQATLLRMTRLRPIVSFYGCHHGKVMTRVVDGLFFYGETSIFALVVLRTIKVR